MKAKGGVAVLLTALKPNCGKCPVWDVSVGVSGLYKQLENDTWSFARAECPIIQNSKLPVYDQDPRYKYMKCPDPHACPLYTQFQPLITSKK